MAERQSEKNVQLVEDKLRQHQPAAATSCRLLSNETLKKCLAACFACVSFRGDCTREFHVGHAIHARQTKT